MYYKLRKYFAIVLVGVIGLLMLNNTLFMHLHRLSDGTLIVHAHPFSKSNQADNPSQTHKHTKVELLVLNSLLILFVVCIFRVAKSFVLPKYLKHYFHLHAIAPSTSRTFSDRAPPLWA